jgi:23S rRNA pseudouridine2605 synthase
MKNNTSKTGAKSKFSTAKPFAKKGPGDVAKKGQSNFAESRNKPKFRKPDKIVGKTPERKEQPKPAKHSSSRLENAPKRLNKVIADSGLTSRRNADELIASGAVRVNGAVVTVLGTKVHSNDRITVKGDPIPENDKKVYYLLNKPKDIIVSVKDEMDRTTVLDIIRTHTRIFPVGRLDRNTTGVLLLTNDGDLAHRLLHPSFQIERTYSVLLDKELAHKDAEHIIKGVELEDGKTAPCSIFFDPRNNKRVVLTLKEGRNHEVKRIFMHFGYNVRQLDRKVFAGMDYQKVPRGDYRQLSKREVNFLKKLVGLEY